MGYLVDKIEIIAKGVEDVGEKHKLEGGALNRLLHRKASDLICGRGMGFHRLSSNRGRVSIGQIAVGLGPLTDHPGQWQANGAENDSQDRNSHAPAELDYEQRYWHSADVCPDKYTGPEGI